MDPIAQALAEIRNPNQGAHDPIAQALTEIRGGSQIFTSPSQPPAPAGPQPARTIPEPPPQPAALEDYYPPEFAGFADPNLAANVEREIREAAPVAPLPIAAPLQDIGRTVQNIMDPTFEYGVAPFLGGAISGTTRFADAAGYLADKIGADTLRDKLLEIGGAGSKFGADLTQGTAPEDIGAIGNLVRGTFGAMGSSLPSLAMGLAATPMQGTSWASGTAAALRGSSDAFGEAGDAMREVLANGGSIEEARSAANKVAAGNLVYNLVAESLVGPFSGVGENIPGLRGRLFRGAVQGAGESIQETLQDMWSAANKKRREDGQPITYLDALGNLIDEGKRLPSYLMESGAPAFMSSFLTGAGIPSVATESTQQPDAAALVSETLEELRKEDDARQALPRGERGELMRWARSETRRMSEEAQFAEDGTPENPLSEADLVRYQEIQDAMKRKDYAALSAMRGAAPTTEAPVTTLEVQSNGADASSNVLGKRDSIREVLSAVRTEQGAKSPEKVWADYARVTPEEAQQLSESTGLNIDERYVHSLVGESVVHSRNKHGETAEKRNDQLPVTDADYEMIPEVIRSPDSITRGAEKTRRGLDTIVYTKRVNGHVLIVEEVRTKRGKLTFHTIRKSKPGYVYDTSLPGHTVTKGKDRSEGVTSETSPNPKLGAPNAPVLKADEGFSHTSETPQTPSQNPSLAESAMPPFETTPLKSGPSEPEPAPASLASTTPTSRPEGDSDWRYENRNLDSTLPPSGEDVNARTLEDGENFEGYEQQDVGPAGTAPEQAESAKAKRTQRPRTPAEIRRLGKEVEARMIAAGRDVEEAKAMGLLASEFAGRFAKRTGIQPAEALNFEMRQGKAQGARGGGYDQSSVRQSEDYDPGDPKTWPEGPGRDEALALEAWQNLENDDEIETWPESPEKARALELQNESRQIDAWIENLSREEFDRRLRDDDPEFVWKNERGVELEKELRSLRRDLRKKKPKGAERRLLQLIEAEEAAAAREAEDAQEYYQERPETTENIRRGQAAMEKVIAEQTDVMDAMHRDDLGSISFLWGEPGRGPKFKGGSGVSHIIAHRNAQGYDGEAVARKMVEVIAKGEVDRRYGAEVPGGERANIVYDGHTAALSLYKDGDRKTWLLTGWKDYEEKAPDVSSKGDGSTGTTLHGPMRARPEEGAGAFNEKSPGASSEGDGSTGATLSGPMRTRPEEGAGAFNDSKPPVAQKDKGESTAPNGRTYFLPDGTSVIEFFETANKSTSFHEFGHHILNKMVEFSGMEGVDPQLAKDVKTILEEAGVSREAFDADTDGARTRAHEFFARGFETYLSEGKAPTARLRDAFRRIRNWMIEVYNDTAKALGIKLSNEMRGVYDRLFASDGAFGDIYGAEDVKAGTNDPAKTQGDAQPRPKTVTTKTRGGVEVERKVRDTSNDTRMMDLFNSPSVVAKRHGKFRPFFGMAKEAVEKQERMRSNWNKAVDAIYGRKGRGGLLSKEQVSLFNETLLEGDALGKAFSADELRERGFDNSMARAYRLVRGLYDNAHRMLSAQRNKYGKEDMEYRKGYVPHFFHAWRVLDDKGIVTSFRSMNEAIRAAEKMKKEDKSRNIRVAPALDDFGGRGKLDAVTLGDTQYSKLMENVEKAFELSAKEARTLLEGAARTKNRSRVFKNAWERKGVAGFDANMEYALRHYLNLSARYIAMDTLKHDGIHLFERAFGRFDNDHKGLARYTKDYINDVLGVPSDVEQTLNNWVRNSWLGKFLPNIIGDRPATVAANSIASLVAHCKLGFLNIASAAMNLSQLNGTQAIIGPIWTARALKEYLHPNQTTLRLYADAGVEENITAENPSGYSKVHQARGLLADTSMMAFRLVDGMARKVTLIGAYRKALSQGMNRSAAIEYAKQVNDDVNFDYSVADAPNFIRRTGPIGTLLFQFKKFPVKMLELALPGVGKLKGWEQVRFWAPLVALTGVFGLPGFDWLKDWLKSIFGKDLELETKKLIAESSLPEPVKRTILYGALSNLGIDIGRRAGMGDFFPSELKDLTGPAAATVARVAESLPKIFDDGNFMDTIEALSPGLANPIKAVMGEARDRRRDRVAFRYETPGERIARATGARPIREAIENDAVRIARYEQQKRSAAEADAIDDFIRARENSDARALDRARDRLRKLRITPDRIRAEMIRRRSPDGGESTAYERAMRGARTPRRIQDYRSMENYAAMWE